MSVDKYQKAKLKEKYGDERVLVIPLYAMYGIEDKFTRCNHTKEIWSEFDKGKYVFRYDAEGESSMQQIIPYVIIHNPENDKYLISKRKEQSGEPRLVGQMSMGFGGHINPEDGYKDVILKAMFRELMEELFMTPLSSATFLGYIRDISSSTNDHTGCVFIIESKDASVREIDKLEGCWMSPKELEEAYFKFESWSKFLIDFLVENNYKF